MLGALPALTTFFRSYFGERVFELDGASALKSLIRHNMSNYILFLARRFTCQRSVMPVLCCTSEVAGSCFLEAVRYLGQIPQRLKIM